MPIRGGQRGHAARSTKFHRRIIDDLPAVRRNLHSLPLSIGQIEVNSAVSFCDPDEHPMLCTIKKRVALHGVKVLADHPIRRGSTRETEQMVPQPKAERATGK